MYHVRKKYSRTEMRWISTFSDESVSRELPALRPKIHDFVASLLENAEVPVLGASRGPVGKVIHALFAAAQKVNVVRFSYIYYFQIREN